MGTQHDGEQTLEEVACLVEAALLHHAQMLREYFSICISSSGVLEALPQLIDGYAPPLERLPAFLLHMARDVEWGQEKPCFHTLAQVIHHDAIGANRVVSSGGI